MKFFKIYLVALFKGIPEAFRIIYTGFVVFIFFLFFKNLIFRDKKEAPGTHMRAGHFQHSSNQYSVFYNQLCNKVHNATFAILIYYLGQSS